MNEPLVSVIVPIYKVEAYLEQCIESIVNQTYTNLEILLMDDGGPDNCGTICDRWAERDKRIRVVHKENSGVSDTRNTGLNLSTGKFVLFVDGDDYLELNAVKILINYAKQYRVQCVVTGYKRLFRDGRIVECPSVDCIQICHSREKVREDVLRRLIGSECKDIKPLSQSACTKLYNRQSLMDCNVNFLPIREIGSEDFYFNVCFFEHADSAVLISECLYVYRDNGNSCSNTYDADRLESFIKLFLVMKDKIFFDSREEYLQMVSANILGGISVCIKLLLSSDEKRKVDKLALILQRAEIREMLSHCKLVRLRFPLNLFCMLVKFRMKYTLYVLISIFIKLKIA